MHRSSIPRALHRRGYVFKKCPVSVRQEGMRDLPDATIHAWTTFATGQRDRTSAELVSDLRA